MWFCLQPISKSIKNAFIKKKKKYAFILLNNCFEFNIIFHHFHGWQIYTLNWTGKLQQKAVMWNIDQTIPDWSSWQCCNKPGHPLCQPEGVFILVAAFLTTGQVKGHQYNIVHGAGWGSKCFRGNFKSAGANQILNLGSPPWGQCPCHLLQAILMYLLKWIAHILVEIVCSTLQWYS